MNKNRNKIGLVLAFFMIFAFMAPECFAGRRVVKDPMRYYDIMADKFQVNQGLIQGGIMTTGNIWYVDSGRGSSGDGTSKDEAVVTIDEAINLATADNDDVIVVVAGHAETLTAAITCDVAGVTIIGLGNGKNAPAITPSAYGFVVSAANVTIENIYFLAKAAGSPVKATVTGANFTMRNCLAYGGVNDLMLVTLSATADDAVFEGNQFIVSANGPDAAIQITASGCDGTIIRNNIFNGGSITNNFDLGAVYSTAVSPTSIVFEDNVWINGANISMGATAATGTDAGAQISGEVKTYAVKTGPVALYSGNNPDIFTISGGPVAVTALVAECYSTVSSNACGLTLAVDPTVGAATTIGTTVDINAFTVGSFIYWDGTIGSAAVIAVPGTAVPLAVGMDVPFILPAGVVEMKLVNSDTTSGGAYFYMQYRPLVPGATVTGIQ